jgi:predicted DNA-binding transcriptional regulator YafY
MNCARASHPAATMLSALWVTTAHETRQIIQILRRTPKPITAGALAAELETSKRTVYRDIADLIGQRVPIRGEAGVGYVLLPGLDLPPLMLTPDEIEAAVLGAQWAARHSDAELARAAQDLIAKIGAVVPERLRPFVFEPVTETPPARGLATDGLDMARVRAQIHAGRKSTCFIATNRAARASASFGP